MSGKPVIRCAIYTRKSSEEGLEQEFNSLDAQHEACAAYVASQRHEGWKLVPQRYDDGGLSGGTLERPALRRLLADIDAGRIGMVVVYKIDRLTRSLADFARLVERLEKAGCSFVSVTQAFNTSSSMGRLTLNVLLSFAQFEREVTAERIRDKIAASKKKGLWMGGNVPLGYDRHPDPARRELVINPEEAKVVELLFALYDRHACLRQVEDAAAALGLRSKRRVFASGEHRGGGRLSRGHIHHLLTNPIYLGRIRHKDRVWPGLHAPIVTEDLWQRIQAKLQAASARPRRRGDGDSSVGEQAAAPLIGKFRDGTGDRLTPTHTTRRGRRLRYYVSNRLLGGRPDAAGWRLPAPAFEHVVAKIVAEHLEAAAGRHALLAVPDAGSAAVVAALARSVAEELRKTDMSRLSALIRSGRLARDAIQVELDPQVLAEALHVSASSLNPALLVAAAPLRLRRRGVEIRLVAGTPAPTPDADLVRVLAKAHRWADSLRRGAQLSEIARRDGHSESYLRTRAQLAFLSPRIQAAILDGTQPPDLTLERIVRTGIPLDWAEQERTFGFGA